MSRLPAYGWLAVALFAAVAASLPAADWPQWRGPNRDGLAPESPELAEAWPKGGPPKVWQSDPLPTGGAAGYGSPVVAGGKVYVFSVRKYSDPIPTRTFTERRLRELGWFPEKPPQALLDKIEQARVSEERAALQGNELNEWVTKWIESNLDEEQRRQFSGFAADRLRRGPAAFDFAVLDKLAEIKDKTFEPQEAFDRWLAGSGIPKSVKQEVVKRVPTAKDRASDAITCFNAADGKTVWKREYPGRVHGNGSSGTPCVAGGRCYALGTDGGVYCLDALKGEEVWRNEVGKGEKTCSPIILDGLLIASAGPLTAFDAATGEVKWKQEKVGYTHCSPVAWEKAGKKYAVCNTGGNVFCADARTGEIAWEAPGGGNSTPVVQGDTMVVFSGNGKVGVTAYRLSLEKAEKVWTIEGFTDRGASPLVHEGRAYAVGGHGVLCIDLESGKELWREKPGTGEISSPILADGKILAYAGGGGVVMLKANPTGCTAVAKAKLGMVECTSPAFFDGKLVVRGGEALHCFDLALKAMPEPEKPSAVARRERSVRADGVLDEWGEPTLALAGPGAVFPIELRNGWKGPQDMGVRLYFARDAEALCLAAAVTDDKHFNTKIGDMIWNGDALQMGLTAPKGVEWNIALALTANGVAFHPFVGRGDALSKAAERAVVRDEAAKLTRYELRLPLAALGVESGAEIGFNVVFFDDDDGNGQRYWLQLAPGLAGGADKEWYPRFALGE